MTSGQMARPVMYATKWIIRLINFGTNSGPGSGSYIIHAY